MAVAALPAAGTTDPAQGESIRWVINYNGNSIPGNAARTIEAAGGELVRTLPQVGVAIAVSADPDFVGQMRGHRRVHSVGEVPAISVPAVTVTRTGFTPAMVPTHRPVCGICSGASPGSMHPQPGRPGSPDHTTPWWR